MSNNLPANFNENVQRFSDNATVDENHTIYMGLDATKKCLPENIDHKQYDLAADFIGRAPDYATQAVVNQAQTILSENQDVNDVTGTFEITPFQTVEVMAVRENNSINVHSSVTNILPHQEAVLQAASEIILAECEVE